MNPGELYGVCGQRNPDPDEQRANIERLVRAGADLHETDKNGVTLLHHAVRFRNPAAVEALLRLGAAVNQTCKRSGSTPLCPAVTSTGAPGKQAQAREIIEILLRYGVDPSIKNKSGKKPADYVRDKDVRRLLQTKAPKSKRKLQSQVVK